VPWFKKHKTKRTLLANDTSPNGVYSGLRQQALTRRSSEIGIVPASDTEAWGVLMEWEYKGINLTLLTLADGTTSLYISNGGGVIGGQSHETVRRASAALLAEVNSQLAHLRKCETFPPPEVDHTIFYVLTDAGMLCGGGLSDDLGYNRHVLSAAFHAGHELLTQLRLVSEAAT